MPATVADKFVSFGEPERHLLTDFQRNALRDLVEQINMTENYRAHPHLSGLRIVPALKTGLPARLHVDNQGCVLSISGLIQEFHDIEEARFWLRKITESSCRLKVETRGGKAYAWTLQMLQADGEWSDGLHSANWSLLPGWFYTSKTEYHYLLDSPDMPDK